MFDKSDNFDEYKEYKTLKMPEDMKNDILASMQEYKPVKKSKLAVKRRVLIYAAMFICLTIAVSAAVIAGRTQYIPFVGFTEDEYEIYASPEIVKLGNAVIETVMRVKDPETGKNDLTIIITDDTVKLWNYRDNLTNLTITTPEGYKYILGEENIKHNGAGGGGGNGVSYTSQTIIFSYEDFPEINEFTISANSANNVSADIMLAESAFEEFYGYTELNGVSIKVMQVAKNSRAFAVEIDEKQFDLDYLFGDKNYFQKSVMLSLKVYDEYGSEIENSGYGATSYSYRRGISDKLVVLHDRPEENLSKIIFSDLRIHGHYTPTYEIDEELGKVIDYADKNQLVYSDIAVPVPEDGSIIEYDEPLLIYNNNGLTCMIEQIERKGDKLIVTTSQYYENEAVEELGIRLISDTIGRSSSSGLTTSEFHISNEDIENQSVRLVICGFSYNIKGEWEIYFGE